MTDVRWEKRANRRSSVMRATGGKLLVEGEDLVFRPTGLESKLGGKEWRRPLAQVREFGVAGINPLEALAGGTRPRLSVRSADGSVDLFVVSKPRDVADELRGLAGG